MNWNFRPFLILLASSLFWPIIAWGQISLEDIQAAERLIGLEFEPAERDSMRNDLVQQRQAYLSMREHALPNAVAPAMVFNPLPMGFVPETDQQPIEWGLPMDFQRPADPATLAFCTVPQLSALLKSGQVSSLQLTQLYLERLKQYADTLECVISLTEELALKQARRADAEMAQGIYRGPLHGIPYGAKDLLAVPGYPTTWGAKPYENQELESAATVISRLEEAGAVLVAKLTLGALAWGDVWYGGTTRNPWNLEQGSSGSSAGSASATAAGLVGFSIGTETWGSIVSPSTRCGNTGLRPTFGRVSRAGAMALSWSMDKIGPICRSAKGCALVFDAIRGQDGKDRSLIDASFNYRPFDDLSALKIGYLKSQFEHARFNQAQNQQSLDELRALGAELIPVALPEDIPVSALSIILSAEAGAAFDELTRSNQDELMVRQIRNAWPNVFRASRFIPAVEYIQANRHRLQLIEAMHEVMNEVDVLVVPSFGGNQLLMTNLTGHPCVVMPHGFTDQGSPTSITFLGNLFDEATILAVAEAYQAATPHEDQHPPMFKSR